MNQQGTPQAAGKRPLEGLKVVDLASLYAGPLIATTLGDFGATVIKVEHPRGDDARRWGLTKDGISLWWKVISRNKRLIRLDLHDEADRAVARELCEWADVVIENFRPGRLESWGLGYDELKKTNPKLVMARVTGFGQTGPYHKKPGFGTLAEAFSGFAYMTGAADGPPTLPAFGLADGVAALAGTYAVMMAIYWRDARGGDVGQVVDLSLYEPLSYILGPHIVEYDQTGVVQKRNGNRSPRTAPRNAYETSDGNWVVLSAGTQQIANRVFQAIDRPEMQEDERFATPRGRMQNAEVVDQIVGEWIAKHDLDTVIARFEEVEAPIAPVYNARQIVNDAQYRERESVLEVKDEDLGHVLMQNVVPKLSLTPGKINFPGRSELDRDRDFILQNILRRGGERDGSC